LDEGTFDNGKLHGFAKCYYAIKETLFYCGTYNHGMRQGYGAEYYENGKMKKRCYWNNGKQSGFVLAFNEQGLRVLK
jgi:antitoxin component YwqK of YwqJK toxin-antitoxin module